MAAEAKDASTKRGADKFPLSSTKGLVTASTATPQQNSTALDPPRILRPTEPSTSTSNLKAPGSTRKGWQFAGDGAGTDGPKCGHLPGVNYVGVPVWNRCEGEGFNLSHLHVHGMTGLIDREVDDNRSLVL